MKFYFALSIIPLFLCSSIFGQEINNTYYKGNILVAGQEILIELEFFNKSDTLSGSINIPQQGVTGLKLDKFSYKHPNIYFEILPAPQNGIFKGTVSFDSISGSFQQMGFSGNFLVKKAEKVSKEVQIEKPYNEEEITFNNGEIKIAGTLSYPKSEGVFPAVILISGSGAQNRDSEVFGFKLFEKVADYFTKKGIAVLRTDDRGVGGSTGNISDYTSEDFGFDAINAFEFLKTKKFINPQKIGFYGHSEGGIVAPIAVSNLPAAAFAILVSPPGVTGEEIIMKQIELISLANGDSQANIAEYLAHNRELLSLVKSMDNLDSLRNLIQKKSIKDYNKLSSEFKSHIPDSVSFINSVVNNNLKTYTSNWFRFFVNYNPAPILQNVKCPILLVFGGLDTQVDEKQNRQIIEDNLRIGGNTNVKTLFFEKANHLYQKAENGSVNEYSKLDKIFIEGFLEQISEWIIDTTK